MIKSFLCSILILLSGVLSAQVTEFSTDPEKFIKQMEKHLASFNRSDAKEFAEVFEPVWLSMDASVKSQVISLSNAMTTKKFRPYPEFKDYWQGVYECFGGKSSSEVFNQWQGILDELIELRKKDRFQDFLASSSGLIVGGILYQSNVVRWDVRGGSFTFTYRQNSADIDIQDASLVCYANDDSTVIEGTSGVFQAFSNKWEGRGGKVYWIRAGLDPGETYAELAAYLINIKTSAFRADSVMLTTPFFDEPIVGKIDEKVKRPPRSGKVSYPQFISDAQNLRIADVVPGVDYEGAFKLEGPVFIGSGKDESPASMIFYDRNDQPFIITRSTDYMLDSTKISARSAEATILIGEDTISHPSVILEYIMSDRKGPLERPRLSLTRPKEGLGQSPFLDTYHQLEIRSEAAYWEKGDTLLNFGRFFGSTVYDCEIESVDFFNADRFSRLAGVGGVNPAIQLWNEAKKLDKFEWTAPDLASAMGYTVEQIKPAFYNMSNMGLIKYSPSSETIKVRSKLKDYMEASMKKADHDPILFISDVSGIGHPHNATVNTKTLDMKIRGLKRVVLSEAQFVRIYPDTSQEITVHKNRGMSFGGIIAAGSTEYFGSNFTFEYDAFKLNLIECDSMRFRVWPFDNGQRQVRLVSVLEDVKGDIRIDDPMNKSGYLSRDFPDYPKLSVTKETYVFYDKQSIQGGVYDRSNFYFLVAPFEMDSLDNFNRDYFALDGVFKSADIFPEFAEQLKVQDDYSLGFVRKAEGEGVGIYSDNGNFKNTIRLSAQGLQGDGKIEFLTSTAYSDLFTFYPDSTSGIANEYANVTQKDPLEVPDVVGENVYVRFIPKEQVLQAASVKEPLRFIGEEATLKGRLYLTPEQGVTARGKMYFGNGILSARRFYYKQRQILSDTSEFVLTSVDLDELTMETENVSADVDFDKREGLFKSNDESNFVTFPENQYICYMDEFKWFMDADDIELQKKQREDLTIETTEFDKPNFYSVHPDQDSLSFMAPKARYDGRKKIITCKDVPFIDVADARIVPDSGLVTVYKKADIETLENAVIIANNVTKNHRIENATVEVLAKRKYEASGDYFYVDETGESFKFSFVEIKPDSSYQTYAEGEILETDSFKLSPNFEFLGKVELQAANKFLVFDGATRIAHNCNQLARNWMNFRAEIDPQNIMIPVGEDMTDQEGEPIGTGVVLFSDSISLYSTFLSRKGDVEHPDILTASGFLYFDKGAKEYRIASEDKLKERSLPGNYVSLHSELCVIHGDGKIALDHGTGQMHMNTVGNLTSNMASGELTLRGSMGLDFPFPEKAIEAIADRIEKTEGLDPIDLSSTFYEKGLREIVGLDEANKIMADVTLKGEFKGKVPDEIVNPIYLADVRLQWDGEGSFRSKGPIGIANFFKDEVFKNVNGFIEIRYQRGRKKENRGTFTMYFELDDKTWYFFQYSNETLSVRSSDEKFNSVIAETKEDDLKYKGERGEDDLVVRLEPSDSKVRMFRRQFEDE